MWPPSVSGLGEEEKGNLGNLHSNKTQEPSHVDPRGHVGQLRFIGPKYQENGSPSRLSGPLLRKKEERKNPIY